MDVGADIDDTYVISMKFKESFGNLLVDVVSRYAVRSLIMNMEYGQILWKWDEGITKLYDAIEQRWVYYHCSQGQTAEGYNKNIIEDMYIDELRGFISAVSDREKFPNSLDEDIKTLKLLERAEKNYAQR